MIIRKHIPLITLVVFIHAGFFLYGSLVEAPSDFVAARVVVEEGASTNTIATTLKEKNIIPSSTMFKVFVYASDSSRVLRAGEYNFDDKDDIPTILDRLRSGDYNLPRVSIHIPEGSHRRDIARIVSDSLPHISEEAFLNETMNKEGYLYPTTYLFAPTESLENVVDLMEQTFLEETKKFSSLFRRSPYSKEDIIKMASIVEREAHLEEEQKVIAGILWNRIEKGIALQVDVSFYFINGKNTFTLTSEDLKTSHPYNSYTNTGLPPTPIGSPSAQAIEATLLPTESEYFFFLADKTGTTHYSRTFEEHKQKRRQYLNQ